MLVHELIALLHTMPLDVVVNTTFEFEGEEATMEVTEVVLEHGEVVLR